MLCDVLHYITIIVHVKFVFKFIKKKKKTPKTNKKNFMLIWHSMCLLEQVQKEILQRIQARQRQVLRTVVTNLTFTNMFHCVKCKKIHQNKKLFTFIPVVSVLDNY